MSAHILGLHVNPEGGVPKYPVETLEVVSNGCLGDKQNNLEHHGGPTRAVCLMLESVMKRLQNHGHPIGPGTTGENILIGGLEPEAIGVGMILKFSNNVSLKITAPTPPCEKIKASFENGEFTALSHKMDAHQTRWYASVVVEGTLSLGEGVQVVNEFEPAGSQ